MAKDKQAHVYVYGIVDAWQDSGANDWGYVNLNTIKNQLASQSDYEEIVVHIHSEGGVVIEGFAIHDFLKSQGKKIITKIDGVCASIATVILLAGEERIGSENAKPLIHNPWGMVGGESKDVKKYAEELEQMEEDIAEFYAKKTSLTKEQALEYMRVETQFTADEALKHGLLTKIESVMRAVALYNPNKKKKMAKSEKKEKKNEISKIVNKILKDLGIKKNAKVVSDATGTEIDFFELDDTATEAVGDKAKVDGKSASGDYVMPSGDTYTFADGVLESITEKEEEEEEEEPTQAQVDDLNAQLLKANDKIKALKTDKKALKQDVADKDKTLNSVNKQMKKLESELEGSNFEYTPKKKNHKKKKNTRSVFKEVAE